jgi:F-type H+-transporting ATPase subunit epsilon
MEDKGFEFSVITPERVFFKGQVLQIIVDALDGSMGILKNMSPRIIGLEAGEMRFQKPDGSFASASYGSGFIKADGDSVLMLVETAEWPEEIETERVKRTIEEKERQLEGKQKSKQEYLLCKASLARAFARLKVKDKSV